MAKALVIGAGPSLERFGHWDLIKKFKGYIVVTDFMLKHCIAHDITPDYVCTAENTKRITDFFIREGLHKADEGVKDKLDQVSNKIICVTSRKTHEDTRKIINSRKWKDCIEVSDPEIDRSSNVGLFCWKFAWHHLACKDVVLIGMDHAKPEGWEPKIQLGIDLGDAFKLIEHPDFGTKQWLDPIFQHFRKEFLESAANSPVNTINCTEGGSLFGKNIKCMKFKDYL